MCGRYTLTASGEVLQRELNLERVHELGPRYNLAPMQVAPIVTNANPRDLTLARWGLLPAWAKDATMANRMINARSETLEEKKAFAQALQKRRCLVPCDGFFEWKKVGKAKQPLHITFQSKRLMTMAGLWATWRSPEGVDVVTFTIVTTASNPLIAAIHDRMPVFLDGKDRETWLGPATQDVTPFTALLHPWTGEALTMTEVSSRVNSVSVDDAECLAPPQSSQLSLL
jgi:putative SOS response-associated peptidase YedK